MAVKLQLIIALVFGLIVSSISLVDQKERKRSGRVERRQLPSDLNCENYPEVLTDNSECVNAFEIRSFINSIDADLFARNTGANRNLLQRTLDGFCDTVCYDNVVFYYSNCTGSQDSLDYYQNVVCGRNGGTYCVIALLGELASNNINEYEIELQCESSGDTCPRAECVDILQGISSSLGCCAANLFNQSVTDDSPFRGIVNQNYYEDCNLTLPMQCSGSSTVVASSVVMALVVKAMFWLLF